MSGQWNRSVLREAPNRSPRDSRPPAFESVLVNIIQLLVLAGIACFVWFLFVPTLDKSRELEREIARNHAEIVAAQRENEHLKEQIAALKSDPAYVERQARDRLNLARTNETVFRFQPYPGDSKPKP